MKSLLFSGFDPAFNLALEETLFQSMEETREDTFLLWRNGPSIIVGRHQNTVEEINEAFIAQSGLPVVRRTTGGGAVYHDTGNLNFSFLQYVGKGTIPDFKQFLEPVIEVLHALGVPAEMSSRNDITVEGRKISGSAKRRSGPCVLQHGTLMVDLDSSVLGNALTGNPDKYLSKGVASHKSRVANLREFLPEPLKSMEKEALVEHIAQKLLQSIAPTPYPLSPDILATAEKLAAEKYRSWEWNYGHSPAFTAKKRCRFPWGAVEVCLEVEKGLVTQCTIFGDFFSQQDGTREAVQQALTGIPHREDAFSAALAALPPPTLEDAFLGADKAELIEFLAKP